MPEKEKKLRKEKARSKKSVTKTPKTDQRRSTEEQASPGDAIQRARRDPGSLASRDVLQLQRTLGNRPVAELVAEAREAGTAVVQRQPDDRRNYPGPVLREGQHAAVEAGSAIRYTSLAAGSMAITAVFEGGGGAGQHLAMMQDNTRQWAGFSADLRRGRIARLLLESDMIGQKQGWWVRYRVVDRETLEYGGPSTNDVPRSYAELVAQYRVAGERPDETDRKIFAAGWVFEKTMVADWFQAKLGVRPEIRDTQQPEPHEF